MSAERMRAVLAYGPDDVRLEWVASPRRRRPGDVRIAVEACGICGTDLEEVRQGPSIARTLPIILGHEVVGHVIEADETGRFAVGDRVAVDGNTGCGHCAACCADEVRLCVEWEILGLSYDGGLAEQVVVAAEACIPIGRRISPVVGTLIEPLSVAVKALRRLAPDRGAPLLVVGAGAIGLFVIQLAALHGVREVVAVEPDPARREIALVHGAVLAEHPDRWDGPVPGGGFPGVIDVSGSPHGLTTALRRLAPGGTVLTLALTQAPYPLGLRDLVLKEQTILTSVAHSRDRDLAVARDHLEEGAIDGTPMLDDIVTLDDAASRLCAPRGAPAPLRSIVDLHAPLTGP